MNLRIERAVSEVTPEPEPVGGGATSVEQDWEALDRVRALQVGLVRDRLRTRAEEFDD